MARAVIGLIVAAIAGTFAGWSFTRWIDIPKVEALARHRPSIETEILDTDGKVLTRFAIERRVILAPGQIPPLLRSAILAIEDHRFFSHGGVDPVRIALAAYYDLATGTRRQGASTITQQLARKVFLTDEKTFRRKLNEILLAFEIERRFSKDQIFALYANQVYLGDGNYGIEAGARGFFGKRSSELGTAEAATLAALIQRPDYLARHSDELLQRRNVVIRRMSEEGWISQEEASRARQLPLVFAEDLQKPELGAHFIEEVRREIEREHGVRGLYREGLRVRTTLVPELQLAAERAVDRGLRSISRTYGWKGPIRQVPASEAPTARLAEWRGEPPTAGVTETAIVLEAGRKGARLRVGDDAFDLATDSLTWTGRKDPSFLAVGDVVAATPRLRKDGRMVLDLDAVPSIEAALVILANNDGSILAMVGGRSFDRSKFNRATQAHRQAGSVFKPFVYLAALEQGLTAADTLFDMPVTFTAEAGIPPYTPSNYYKKSYGIQTLQQALAQSHNVLAVKLLMMVGPNRVIEATQRLGLEADLKPYPSMALGAFEVDLLHMTSAFACFASQGVLHVPHTIRGIEDAEGRQIEEHQLQAREMLTAPIAYQMVSLLEGVVKHGTAWEAKNDFPMPIGGKTGTTDDYSDAWFVGFSPTVSIGVWVGRDTKKPIGREMTGARAALPIWIDAMKAAVAWDPKMATRKFEVPAGLVFVPVDVETGRRAVPSCRRVDLIPVPPGSEPAEECGDRWHSIASLPASLQLPFYEPKPNEVMSEGSYAAPVRHD